MISLKKYLTSQDKSNPCRFYVYAYLRSKDSDIAKAGMPYYIGKGCGKRAWSSHGKISIPPNISNIIILETNLSEIGALALERRYIRWYGKRNNTSGILLNSADGGDGTSGSVSVKDKDGNTFSVSTSDPRFLSKELVSVQTGKTVVKDKAGNIFSVSTSDPRFLSKELVSIHAGKVLVKDKDGNIIKVPKTDPRYLSGELIAATTGNASMIDKDGNAVWVSKTDPRYLSGELIGNTTGKTTVKDKDGNTCMVSKTDPRYLSGELIAATTGKLVVRDVTKQITFSTSVSNIDYINKKLIAARTRFVFAKTKEGKIEKVSVTDDRWLKNELFLICI